MIPRWWRAVAGAWRAERDGWHTARKDIADAQRHPARHHPAERVLTVRFFSYEGGCVHVWDATGRLVQIIEGSGDLDAELKELIRHDQP